MHNMVHPQETQHPIVEISSPLGARLEFSESELFPDALQNSEVASISSNNNTNNNCGYEEHSSYNNNNNNISNFTMDNDNANNNYNSTATTPPTAPTGKDNHPLFFEDDDDDQLDNNDISASIDFTPSSPSFSLPQHHQYFNNNNNNNDHNHNNINNSNNQEILFSMSSMYNNDNHIQISSGGETYMADRHQYNIPERPLIPTAYNNNNNEESGFMSSVSLPSYYNSNIDPMINIGNYLPFSFDVFTAGNGLFLGNDVSAHHHHQELELQGDNIGGIFHPDSAMARVFNYSTGDIQVVSSEGQHQLLHGSPNATLASEISSLEDPNFKVTKLSVEERKRKIHRYLKKRNERNFSKKIKYACRKTLADSRPRVRGRFARNDELAEINIARTGNGTETGHNHEDDTYEDGASCLFSNPTPHLQHNKGLIAEEELEVSDIFAQISGVNSFKCNYPIQSWI